MSHDLTDLRRKGELYIEMALNARTQEDWKKIWASPKPDFPFAWGDCWKQSFEYRVDDFAVELAFYYDVLGFPFFSFEAGSAMFTSPDRAFLVAIKPAEDDAPAVNPNAIKLEFMVEDIFATVRELESRGVAVEEISRPWGENAPMYITRLRTPHGVELKFWGMTQTPAEAAIEATTEATAETAEAAAETTVEPAAETLRTVN